MVMFSSWLWKAPDLKICSDLPMSGESTGLGVPTPALAGYLGKGPDTCPWCAVRGQTHALRSYRVSFQESVTLCTNPQCLFPLQRVTEELSSTNGIRCRPCSVDLSSSVVSQSTLLLGFTKTSTELQTAGLCGDVIPISPEDHAEKDSELKSVKHSESEPESKSAVKPQPECKHEENSEIRIRLSEVEPAERKETNAEQQLGKDLDFVLAVSEEELVVAPSHLFWKNEQNLCWLNTLLVALVYCHPLREVPPGLLKDTSPVCRLLGTYNQSCSLMKAKEQLYKEVVKVPAEVLHQAQLALDDIRMSIFKRIQPKLQCQLGDKESPVFALPLLLRQDVVVEELFLHALEWAFECAACGHTFSNRCKKTITTFTHVLPEWHPLTAVHRAPCSRCHHKQQRRRMVLERLSQVFALHFVDGLPHSDVSKYSFDFQGTHYSVRIIIQYDQKLMHFVTWLQTDRGSWIEFDDLKHPVCIVHEKLDVPPDQIHVVFWESRGKAVENQSKVQQHNLSLPSLHGDTDVVSALTIDDRNTSAERTDEKSVSISNSTVMDAFKGLSHSDSVTLTLVEVRVDAQGMPQDCNSGITSDQADIKDQNLLATKTESPSSDQATTDVVVPSPQQKRLGRNSKQRKGKQVEQSQTASPSKCLSAMQAVSTNTSVALSTASNARWSSLLSRHPSLQSTPLSQRSVPGTPLLKPALKVTDNEGLPVKAADMFVGFKSQGNVEPKGQMLSESQDCTRVECGKESDVFKQPWTKSPGPQPSLLSFTKPLGTVGASSADPKTLPNQDVSDTSIMKGFDGTDSLRHKLLKKLKKKKMKLAALNALLKKAPLESVPTPDSTGFNSPSTVSSTSSVYSSPAYSEFFSGIVSPSKTTSSLSPDSTGLLEMLVNGQEGVADAPHGEVRCVDNNVNPLPNRAEDLVLPEHTDYGINSVEHDFLEEFMSDSCVTKNVDLSAFDLFF
ncbi:SUMO-specific isopeptidase USPL1 isoform X2 [Scleropages formosus]|uniref:SUMO-specific isopeptidase USPL1 isoform X2 n=1 Tax=Scleropages formosus TaxID=113540 RepID=UPI0008786C90|nr:SUMO-specific isopeptidase USPL1 isoform X2 [Scleropages formosus]